MHSSSRLRTIQSCAPSLSVGQSVPPSLMMVEDRAATSIRHCPAWIPSQHVTLKHYESFTSTSHQLECSRHPFINIQHTIFIKFQTFRKILNIISSSDGLFENSKYDMRSLLSVNCMSQPVQLKGCPVLFKFTTQTPPVLLTRSEVFLPA